MQTTLGEMLKNVLSSTFGGQFYPGQGPEGVAGDYATYLHFGPFNTSLTGQSDLQNQRLQIDVWSDTKLQAETLAAAADVLIRAQSHRNVSPQTFTATPISFEYTGPDPITGKERVLLEYSVWGYFFDPPVR